MYTNEIRQHVITLRDIIEKLNKHYQDTIQSENDNSVLVTLQRLLFAKNIPLTTFVPKENLSELKENFPKSLYTNFQRDVLKDYFGAYLGELNAYLKTAMSVGPTPDTDTIRPQLPISAPSKLSALPPADSKWVRADATTTIDESGRPSNVPDTRDQLLLGSVPAKTEAKPRKPFDPRLLGTTRSGVPASVSAATSSTASTASTADTSGATAAGATSSTASGTVASESTEAARPTSPTFGSHRG